jgi:hypothetical protein
MRHIADAETEARTHYDRSHSNDPTGADQEEIPRWAREFFRFFEAQETNPPANDVAMEVRRGRTAVVRSVVGAQAPLGHSQEDGIAQLPIEISRNNATNQMRQRTAGNVDIRRMSETEMNDYRTEGVHDNETRRPAQRRRTGPRDGRTRRIVDFSADRNDPISRFFEIQQGFQSVSMLSDAIQQNMHAPLPIPLRTGRDVANDYQQASAEYHSAVLSGDDMDIQFWNARRTSLRDELAAIESSTVNSNEESNSSNND